MGYLRKNKIIFLFLLLALGVSPLAAQSPPSSIDSPTGLMVDVLKSPTTDYQLRLKYAQILVHDPDSQPILADLLKNSPDATTRRLLCLAIANGHTFSEINGQGEISDIFIDPLIDNLFSDQPLLRTAAMEALYSCRQDLVLIRLSELVNNESLAISYRLIGISALEILPGKVPVCVISSLLEDQAPEIRERAYQSLSDLFTLPTEVTLDQFRQEYVPHLENMEDHTLLSKQVRHWQRSLHGMEQQLEDQQSAILYWQQLFLDAKTKEFEQIILPEKRIEFLESFLAQQKEVSIRLWALAQLQKWMRTAAIPIDPVAKPLSGLLIKLIHDPNAPVRQQTAMALAQLGENAVETSPEVLKQLQQEQTPSVQAALLDTLGILHHIEVIPEALKLLPGPDPNVSAAAARALGRAITSLTSTDTIDIAQVIRALHEKWRHPKITPLVKREITGALGKIAAAERFQNVAMSCDDVLKEALNDADPAVRSLAIPTLAQWYGTRVMALLINGKNMLNDPDLGVRFAVVEAMQKYGSEAHLPLLRERLSVDVTNDDLAKEIRKAFGNILSTVEIPQVYHWVTVLQTAATAEHPLRDTAILVLIDKINQARASGQAVDPQQEALSLTYQAEIALKQNQPLAAVTAYSRLAELKTLDEPTRQNARQGIFQLTLTTPDEPRLTAAQGIISSLVTSPAGAEALAQLDDTLAKLDLTKPDQLILACHMIVKLIIPLRQYPTEVLQQHWQKRRYEVALALVDSQIQLLANDNGVENVTAISLMPKLDTRLQPFPAGQGLSERRQVLQRFHTLLTTSLSSLSTNPVKNSTTLPAATGAGETVPAASDAGNPNTPPKTP